MQQTHPLQGMDKPSARPLVVMFPVVTRYFLVIMWLSNCNIRRTEKIVHEISQFDIPDHQLLATKAQQRMGILRDIGEAKITRSVFGRAKVRVIREKDKKRRAWLMAALAVMAIAAAAWQGWIAFQQMQSAPPPLSLNERIRVGAPVFRPENIAPATPSVRDRQKTPTQIVIDSMTTRREPAPKQPLGLKASRQMGEKPDTGEPLTASKPLTDKSQTAPLAANNSSSKNQADMQQPPKLSTSTQLAAPAVAARPATQPAVKKPADVAPLAEQLIKQDASTLPPAGVNQPPGPVNAKP